MIAIATGRRVGLIVVLALSLTGAAALRRAWPAPEPLVVAEERPRYLQVHGYLFRGEGMEEDDPNCLAFLDEWMAHPGWTLTLTRAVSADVSVDFDDAVVLDSEGHGALLDPAGHRRPVLISQVHLDAIRAAARASCVYRRERWSDGSGVPSIGVIWGGFAPSPRWLGSSWDFAPFDVRVGDADAQARLTAVVASIASDYAYRRLADRGAFRLAATLPAGTRGLRQQGAVRVTVDDEGRLEVRTDGWLRGVRELRDPVELAAMLDWIETDGAVPAQLPGHVRWNVYDVLFGADDRGCP